MLPATFSPPHLPFFSTLLCLLSSSSSLPPLLPSSYLSQHCPPISVLASLISSCPALVTLPLSSVIGHRPSFLRVQPTVVCSSSVSLSSTLAAFVVVVRSVSRFPFHTGVPVSRFEFTDGLSFEIRSGYLLLANQHTSSEGQGSRDLYQTHGEPY